MTWRPEEKEPDSIFDKNPRLEIHLTVDDGGAQNLEWFQVFLNMDEIEHWLQKITGKDYESFRLEARSE